MIGVMAEAAAIIGLIVALLFAAFAVYKSRSAVSELRSAVDAARSAAAAARSAASAARAANAIDPSRPGSGRGKTNWEMEREKQD